MSQEIVIIRHAHRDTTERDADNGLSSKGRDQVQKLINQLKENKFPPGMVFLSSPKKRCIETLEPLAKKAGKKMRIEPLLDEQGHDETTKHFDDRIVKLSAQLMKLASTSTVYISSHGDLIPRLVEHLTGFLIDLDKGRALILRKEKNKFIPEKF